MLVPPGLGTRGHKKASTVTTGRGYHPKLIGPFGVIPWRASSPYVQLNISGNQHACQDYLQSSIYSQLSY
jgi:hypothetical protein